MRTLISIALLVLLASAIALLAVRRNSKQMTGLTANTQHIVLIGASIGQSWHLADWPSRVKTSRFTAESIAAWQFDKTEAMDEVLIRPSRKFRLTRSYLRSLFQPPPKKADIVILKECSSYFPGDLSLYERSIEKWAGQLQANHRTVILATVVPVTQQRAQQSPGKQESLLKYNEWIREYARHNGLQMLDLEAALRRDEPGNFLREQFAAPDGSHLNAAAYAVLDARLLNLVMGMTLPVTDNHSIPILAH